MKKILIALLVLIVVGVATYFIVFKGKTEGGGQGAEYAQKSPAASAATVKVSIKNFAFAPTPLTVKKGTTVIWTNDDSAPHTVTSVSGGPLNSGTLSTGNTFSFVFSQAGSFDYFCTIHPTMKGRVIVTE